MIDSNCKQRWMNSKAGKRCLPRKSKLKGGNEEIDGFDASCGRVITSEDIHRSALVPPFPWYKIDITVIEKLLICWQTVVNQIFGPTEKTCKELRFSIVEKYFSFRVVLHEGRHSARRKQLSHLEFSKSRIRISVFEKKTAIMSH